MTSFVETQAGGLSMAARGSAVRRRERRVRSWWRHEQASVRMAMITAGHHSYRKAAGIEVGVQAGTTLAPVTEYVAPAPAVVCDVPATVIEYMPSAPVIGYLAPAPAVSYPSSGLVDPQFSLTADETSHVAPAVTLSVPSQQLPFVYTTTTVTTDDLEEFTEPVYDQVHQEQIAAGEMSENIVEIPVVTEYFPMTDDEGGELSAGVRPAPLEEGRPQGKLQRQAGIGYKLVQALDAPVLQMVEQLPDVHHFFATCLPVVAEQVIDVPKIILENIPSRRLCRDTQLAEQLVEVPTIVSYSLLQRTMEHNVDIPVPGGGGRRGRKRRTRLWPKLERRPGQGSPAFCGAEQDTLADSRPGQGSTAFGGAEHQTHRGFPQGHCSPAFGGAQYGFLPGQGSTVFGGAYHGFLPGSSSTVFYGEQHHGFLPGSSSTAFGGAQHLHHLPPPLSSDGGSSGVDGAAEFRPMRFCMFFSSGTCFKGNECTFAHAWEELHPDSPEWGLQEGNTPPAQGGI